MSRLTIFPILIILLVSSPLLVFSTNKPADWQAPASKIDSLRKIVANHQDTALVDIFNELSWNYRNINIDSSLAYAERAFALSKVLDYANGTNHSLNFMGIAYRNKSHYSKALELFFAALKSSEASKDLTEISYTLINIGNIYLYQTNFDGALIYFERSLKNARKIDDLNLIAYCHLNIGRSYRGSGDYSQAEQYFIKTKKARKLLHDLEGLAIVNVDLSELYIKQNELDKAMKLLLDNLKNIRQLEHKSTLTYSYLNIVRVLINQNNLTEAYTYAQECLRLTKLYDLKNNEMLTLGQLAEIHEKRKDYRQSLQYHRAYIEKKDSIFNEENTRKIESLHAQYITEKKEVETSFLKEQATLDEIIIKRQRMIIILSISVIFLLMILAVIFYWSARERKKLNYQIKKQKEAAYKHNNDLIDINKEKNDFIRILSHDLRAPINNVKGLVDVHRMDHQDNFSDAEKRILNLIRSESDRMLTMISKILNTESLDSQESIIKSEKVDLVKILDVAMDSFEQVAKLKDIELVKHYSSDSLLIIGDNIHMHQVVENLVSNALKFTESGKKIFLDLEDSIETVRIKIKDQGPGLTEADKTKIFKKFQKLSAKPTADEESSGLGLSIVKRYVEEMNGKIWYESVLHVGTTFIVEFEKVVEQEEQQEIQHI